MAQYQSYADVNMGVLKAAIDTRCEAPSPFLAASKNAVLAALPHLVVFVSSLWIGWLGGWLLVAESCLG